MDKQQQAMQWIAAARRLVVFTGAGVSADSGVPTFRGSGADSFWGRYSPEQLATPHGFADDPKLVYDWYTWRRTQLAVIQPNPAHQVIGSWQSRFGAAVITQNIDGLHERLAPPGSTVLRLHGTLAADRCQRCPHREEIDVAHPPQLRACPRCGALMRPDVVWFGEMLPASVWDRAVALCHEADVMVVVGTSGEVHPACDLVYGARRRSRIILVNLEPGALDSCADIALHARAAEALPAINPLA